MRIAAVTENDLDGLLPLMRGYCDFYEAEPSDEELLTLSRSLIADPDCEGFQILAWDQGGRAVGFATVYWSWSTLSASRHAIMNDLFVQPDARGTGVAEALIEECSAIDSYVNLRMASWPASSTVSRAATGLPASMSSGSRPLGSIA